MKALTVRQPWAWAIARGGKDIENRKWSTSYRGLLAIHSAKRWDADAGWAIGEIHEAMTSRGLQYPPSICGDPPSSAEGAVVAVVELVDICTAEHPECGCGPWSQFGQLHWRVADARALAEPVPCNGRLSVWDLPADVAAAVRAQLDGEAC